MLVVKRKDGERVRVVTSDGEIWITTFRCREGNVRLGFEAPDGVQILREEAIGKAEEAA